MPSYQNQFPPTSLDAPGSVAYLFGVPNTAAAIATQANGGLARTSGITLVKTSAAHNFIAGQRVSILGTTSNLFGAGTDKAAIYGFDGEYTIATVPTTTTFTVLDPQKPNDIGGSGNAISVAAETVTGGERSSQVSMPTGMAVGAAPGVIVTLDFTAAPTSGSIQIQESTDDVASAYVLPTATAYTVALGAALHYETDLIPFGSRFLSLFVGTVPGAGNMMAKALRVQ